MRKMTPDEQEYFISAAQMGMACGLTHPWEWLVHSMRCDWLSYDVRPSIEQRYIDAFVAFWNGCDSHPDDPCKTATAKELFEEIDNWYARRKNVEP